MIAIQTIGTTWTKASRGGELAVMRSRVPKLLPLKSHSDLPDVLWHKVGFGETNRFESPLVNEVTSHVENNRFGCRNIYIDWTDCAATLTYRYHSGAPERFFFDNTGTPVPPEHSIHISMNHWASIEYNGRFTCIDTGNWWYEHAVANVAVMRSFDHRVFVASAPCEHYTQLAALW